MIELLFVFSKKIYVIYTAFQYFTLSVTSAKHRPQFCTEVD